MTETRSSRAAPLDLLLEKLAASGEPATAYERLRSRLVTYFRMRVPPQAEALADEAIDRLARRLGDGTPVANLGAYALGIARLLVLEAGARHRKELNAAREAGLRASDLAHEGESDSALPALRSCLEAVGPEAAAFILDYYVADSGSARIAARQAMAERSGTSLNALRNRALRIRMGLEKCVRARLQNSDESSKFDTMGNMPAAATPHDSH